MNGKNVPPRVDIERQLTTILGSEIFASSPRVSALLARLVEDNLNSSDIEEYTLGVELFDRRTDWIPMDDRIVHQNMANLRNRLAKYYREHGAEDPVIITFPRVFRADFSYNPNAPFAARCRDIAQEFYHAFPDDALYHVRKIKTLIESTPSYAPAHAYFAEMLLVQTVFAPPLHACDVGTAENEVLMALQLNEHLWHAHLVNGALHSCRFRWSKAKDAFRTALQIDPAQTRCSFWYMAFLMATYQCDEAIECMELRRRMKEYDDANTWIIHATFLYLSRKFDEASHVIREHLTPPFEVKDHDAYMAGHEPPPGKNWLVDILAACIFLERGPGHTAAAYAKRAEDAFAPKWVKGLLCLCLASSRSEVPGFSPNDAPYQARLIEQKPKLYGPLAQALWLYATNTPENHDSCIELLEKLCDTGNAVMAWLHILPLFHPLRPWARFDALLKRTAPPH